MPIFVFGENQNSLWQFVPLTSEIDGAEQSCRQHLRPSSILNMKCEEATGQRERDSDITPIPSRKHFPFTHPLEIPLEQTLIHFREPTQYRTPADFAGERYELLRLDNL